MALKKRGRTDEQPGNVLGISNVPAQSANPGPPRERRHRHLEGIEVRNPATGIDDVPQRSGATGIDMGSGGEGTNVTDRPARPHSTENEDE